MIATLEAAYTKATDPNRGRAGVMAKNVARDDLKKAARMFVKEHHSEK
ncbi:MAG: hypothetical protein LBC19_01700 [Tannerella sp.]|jgi:hypothetical protein|nr:hypothetical protein [Tannerella sp.]